MLKWWLMFGGYCACLFISGEIYSFVYDVEPNHLAEIEGFKEYDRNQREFSQDHCISFQEWVDRQDTKSTSLIGGVMRGIDWLGEALDPGDAPDWVNDNCYERK